MIAKFTRLLLAAALLTAAIPMVNAQKYVDAKTLRIINQPWPDARFGYGRIQKGMSEYYNDDAAWLLDQTAGVAIRFASNTRQVSVRYTLQTNTHMNHQAPTGTKGVDLYMLDGNEWCYLNTLRPEDQRSQEGQIVEVLDGQNHEFMLYLPTYDGVKELYIGVDEGAEINAGNYDAIDAGKKAVAYGSSIMQGGCCSRPGMNGTAILSRMLNCEVVNMGMSGHATMEASHAKALATIPDVDLFIIDPVPNCDDVACRDKTYDFLKTLRTACPGVPIIMVEGHIYPYGRFTRMGDYIRSKNAYIRAAYDKIVAEDPTNMYYVTAEMLAPAVVEGTVDAVHMTDIGFLEYAKVLAPLMEPFVKGSDIMAITSPADGTTGTSLTPVITWSNPEREGTVEISTNNTFNVAAIVCRAKGTGSAEIPQYALGGGMRYYARVAYDTHGTTCYTTPVQFTTAEVPSAVPAIAEPAENGVLNCDRAIRLTPVEGAATITLEVAAANTFPARARYTSSNIDRATGLDAKKGAEITIGGKALVDGTTYYARTRATFVSNGKNVSTEYSPVVSFTYSATPAAVSDITSEVNVVSTEYYDLSGRLLPAAPAAGQAAIAIQKLSDGTVRTVKLPVR